MSLKTAAYFSDEDLKEFEADLQTDRETVDPELDRKNEPWTDYEELPSVNIDPAFDSDTEHQELFKMLLGAFDDTRAIMAAMYSGQPKEKYKFYKVSEMGPDHYLVRAGGAMLKKWQVKMGPEFIVASAILVSTIFVINQARNDKAMAAKPKKKKPAKTEEGQPETPAKL